MSDETEATNWGQLAYRAIMAGGVIILGVLSMSVLNSVQKTAEAVNDIKISVGKTETKVEGHGGRLDRLEGFLYRQRLSAP